MKHGNTGKRPYNLGVPMSEEQKKKISATRIALKIKPVNWKGGSWVYWRAYILRRDDYTCLVCGLKEAEIVEVAHRVPIKGLKNRVSSGHPLNSEDNLITLCPNDHTRYDKGLIEIL